MMISAVLFSIAAAVAVYVLLPLFDGRHPYDAGAGLSTRAAEDAAASALRDLDLDWSTGKLSDGDYQHQRAALMAEAEARARAVPHRDPARGSPP